MSNNVSRCLWGWWILLSAAGVYSLHALVVSAHPWGKRLHIYIFTLHSWNPSLEDRTRKGNILLSAFHICIFFLCFCLHDDTKTSFFYSSSYFLPLHLGINNYVRGRNYLVPSSHWYTRSLKMKMKRRGKYESTFLKGGCSFTLFFGRRWGGLTTNISSSGTRPQCLWTSAVHS